MFENIGDTEKDLYHYYFHAHKTPNAVDGPPHTRSHVCKLAAAAATVLIKLSKYIYRWMVSAENILKMNKNADESTLLIKDYVKCLVCGIACVRALACACEAAR